MPKGRYGHVALSNHKSDLYVIGGANKFNKNTKIRECFNDIYQLNIEKNTWSLLKYSGSTIDPRRNHTGCIIGKHIFIHGGINEKGIFLKDFSIFNLSILFK